MSVEWSSGHYSDKLVIAMKNYAENEVHISISGEGQFIGEEYLTLEGGSGAFFVKSIYMKTGVTYCEAESSGVKSDICEINVVVR